MHALLIGATGATGHDLLQQLLLDDRFSQISIFVRRELDFRHEKLTTHLIRFDQPDLWRHLVSGDVLYSCLGTTLKAAGSKAAQWKTDYDYQYQFAKAAIENGVGTYVLVSSAHASATSPFFYMKMKGQLEEDVKALHFQRTIILNPPALIRPNSNRKGEIIGVRTLQFFNKMGLFRAQKPLPTHMLAQAMIVATHRLPLGTHHIGSREIWRYASGKKEI